MPNVLASDILGYYSRLNSIRSKFGLGQVSAPTITANITNVTSNQIKTFDNYMTDTANRRPAYITKDLTTGNLEVGQPTMYETDFNIRQMLTTWEGTCYYRADYSDYGDRNHDSDNATRNYESERSDSAGGRRAVCNSFGDYDAD